MPQQPRLSKPSQSALGTGRVLEEMALTVAPLHAWRVPMAGLEATGSMGVQKQVDGSRVERSTAGSSRYGASTRRRRS